ncbi:type II toxin-antitoxin system RelE/ParE family toxin [Campylobacter sp.]|uniref:type II toxin-antitoxin system RelE/ParE family toxin n=1 Tax=Campylobacter sp. TaxID=205 RepID=UPI002A7EF31F|nr:type II toxin-antitoxin system RelE/ParE family toxin [Campylobacter sp.]MCI6339999.1 type II toxin-antitoxin system RelE/ParE family toxin [Campylobacter sp.]MCI6565582.1 type II toxin-antitoxin system RelE/ParE family toxin [Campylobacter sp.]MDY4451470.1 type II toxin-antitoxin system RelE/ParE family toxin [Campylobacter sp.]MDY5115673.1 type II toxin-antitoxin system RelE/ParE family toxin [Campylobacter sp.]
MKFDFKEPFNKGLDDIVSFISLDSSQRALRFQNELMEKIYSLDFMPKRCRKSTLANDESIRDLIFKGYIIVFKIQNDTIKVLYIYKENEPKMIF